MSEVIAPARTWTGPSGEAALKWSVCAWFLVTVAGQWIFALYVASFYGATAARGDIAAWNEVIPGGFVPGDNLGNAAVVAHMLLAVVIMVAGPLQLVPQIRARAPAFHRWSGRIYLPAACITALGGMYMVWTRGTVGGLFGHVAVTINGLLILICAAMALRHALARRLDVHRRWALRLFLVVSGVWFFRVGLMFWLLVNGGPVGFDPVSFEGPFLKFLAVAQYLLPLAILELYLYVRDRAGATGKMAMAGGFVVLTVGTALGVFGATVGMWLPRI